MNKCLQNHTYLVIDVYIMILRYRNNMTKITLIIH